MPENQNENSNDDSKSENAIADYYDGLKQLEIQGYETGVKKARTALFVTAGLVLISEFISAGISGITLTPLMIVIILVEAGIFVGLAFWTKQKPFAAIIIGLILFVGLWVLAIIIAGFRGAIGGIIFKIIIISYLISALKPAKAWEEAKRNM
jgi:hypothetical protein